MRTGWRAKNVPGYEFRGPPYLAAGFAPRVSDPGVLVLVAGGGFEPPVFGV